MSANVQRDIAEAQAADTRRAVNAQLTQQIAALETAFQQIDIATVNVAAATEDLRVQQERYRVGAGTILDLLTSQANLTQAADEPGAGALQLPHRAGAGRSPRGTLAMTAAATDEVPHRRYAAARTS